ncbi:MAG: undecaprenyl-diphosphate phosphatase [Faecousia sp.]
MSLFESVLYGLLTGLAEFLPISSQAHQALLTKLLGIDSVSPVTNLLCHIAIALALIVACKDALKGLYKELLLSQRPKRRRSREPIKRSLYDIALIRTAFYPLAIGFFCYPYTSRILNDIQWMALFLAINGIILFLPPYIRSGNKDSLSMTRADGVLLGLAAGLGCIPGISRMAATTTISSIRGADRRHALHWAFLISIPAIAFMVGFDVRDVLMQGPGLGGMSGLFFSILCAGFAYLGATAAIQIMRFLSVNTGYSGFSFYCWGAALFMFVLYLL